MALGYLFWGAAIWWTIAALVQGLSATLARRRRPVSGARRPPADFSIVAPLAGAADASEGYAGVLRALARGGGEILICIADKSDPALGALHRWWPEASVLLGSDQTFNPKLNNVRKGLEAATRPLVALCDAGIALRPDDLEEAARLLSSRVGLVLALKAGTGPLNFAAEMECAYINGHQARFLLAADRLGMPVASGGVTLLSRDTLREIGVHQGFLHYIADDYSVVRAVRATGRTSRLGNSLLSLPVGERRWGTVWRRQVRWGSTRLNLPLEVRALVMFEPAIGWLAAAVAGVLALLCAGVGPDFVLLALAAHTAAWLAAEGWFLAGYGLPFGPRAWLAALGREVLAPVLAIQAWRGRHRIDWRGTDLAAGWQPSGDGVAGKNI